MEILQYLKTKNAILGMPVTEKVGNNIMWQGKDVVARKLEEVLGIERTITSKELYLMEELKEDYLAYNRQDDRIAIKVQELIGRPVTRHEIKFYRDVLRDFGVSDGNVVIDTVMWINQKKGIKTPTISRIYSTICEVYGNLNPEANRKINKLIALYKRKNQNSEDVDYRLIVLQKLKNVTNQQAENINNYIDLLISKNKK